MEVIVLPCLNLMTTDKTSMAANLEVRVPFLNREMIEMAALLSFQNGRMRVIQDFGTVMNDDCASLRPTAATKATVLSYANATLGQLPKIRVDYYAAGCNKTRRWRAIKGPI